MKAGGNKTNIEIQSDKLVGDAINEYKNMIHTELELKFIFNGQNLDEKLTLKEAGLKNGSRILVISTKDIHGPGGP